MSCILLSSRHNPSGFNTIENKLKLYNFLKQEPIEITNYPDSYSEVKDGNHRFTLAQFAGIKNIPAEYKDSFSGGYIPNFSGLSDAVSREKTALAQRGVPASQIMAHFDRGGNPIAVTNKIDEPNGLKDIPNFAIPKDILNLLNKLGINKKSRKILIDGMDLEVSLSKTRTNGNCRFL